MHLDYSETFSLCRNLEVRDHEFSKIMFRQISREFKSLFDLKSLSVQLIEISVRNLLMKAQYKDFAKTKK